MSPPDRGGQAAANHGDVGVAVDCIEEALSRFPTPNGNRGEGRAAVRLRLTSQSNASPGLTVRRRETPHGVLSQDTAPADTGLRRSRHAEEA